ncbi:MAG TPA: SGNH/GDSL hydrolase family protein [Verrucomicrobiae bacterium]
MTRKWIWSSGLLLAMALVCLARQKSFAANERWVATWGCAPQLVEQRNLPPPPGLAGNTLRQVVHVTIGGKRLRARFSNAFGDGSMTLAEVHFALSAGGGAIQANTDLALKFHGVSSVTIPPEEMVWSDAFDFNLAAMTNVAMTICFGKVPAAITGHPGSRATSYLFPGDAGTAANMPGAVTTQHWYVLTGIDTVADDSAAAVIVLGDSITDGRGSTTDGNNRWPDDLAQRLLTNKLPSRIAVINEGIGGNAVLSGGLGPTAMARFDRDVLEQRGAKWIVVFEGVNDISASRDASVATNLIAAYGKFIDKSRAKGLKVFGATITPFGRSQYSSPEHEAARKTVNDWIRASGRFDAVIDFDAAVRDPSEPANLLPVYDTGDNLHLNPSGYRAMADAMDLKLFGQ